MQGRGIDNHRSKYNPLLYGVTQSLSIGIGGCGNGKGGAIFVFGMGESVKIMALAKRMIRLKGYRYPEDIEIKIVGLRPGEKIYEELLVNEENMGKTCHEKIIIAKVNTPDLAFQKAHVERLCAFVKKSKLQR